MNYSTLFDLTLARARRMGFQSPTTGLLDAADVELAIFQSLVDILGHYDLDAFTVINRTCFVTDTGVETYGMPSDFARFVTPQDEGEYGLQLSDGTTLFPLRYRIPAHFEQMRPLSPTNGRPGYFTISAKRVYLDPPPDSNSSSNYTAHAVYIKDIEPGDLEDLEVPLDYVTALEHAALAQLAIDYKHPEAANLSLTALGSTSALVNRQARLRLQYQMKNTQIGRTSRTWRR